MLSVQPVTSVIACPTAATGPAIQELGSEALARIEVELKAWRDELAQQPSCEGAFRYEMFARRLVAASYGRQDAVVWALEWYADLVRNDIARIEEKLNSASETMATKVKSRELVNAGKSDNPKFQAFLDTLEDPARELYREDGTFEGWKYMVWIGAIHAELRNRKDAPETATERSAWSIRQVQRIANQQRSKRLGGPVPPLH